MTEPDCGNAERKFESQLIYCYNKGCGQKFDSTQNTEESCTFHPGPPYFHDAYKIWKCCNKRSTDFSTWLSFKGCTCGFHSSVNTDPSDQNNTSQNVEPSSKNDRGAAVGTTQLLKEIIKWNGLNQLAERPPNDSVSQSGFIRMPIEVGQNAQRTLARQMEKNSSKHSYNTSPTSFGPSIGATFNNHACKAPKQTDEHIREDWFQRCGLVHISLYCKGALPDKCVFEIDSNGLNMRVHLVHEYGRKDTRIEYSLFGQIQTNDCKAIVNERKVEMILRQAGPENWPRLRYDGGGGAVVSSCDGSTIVAACDGDDADQENELYCVGE